MPNFNFEFVVGGKVVRAAQVTAYSHVHAVIMVELGGLKSGRTEGRIKSGRTHGKPWIRVTDASLKASEFHVTE
jgi:hypothetical protein